MEMALLMMQTHYWTENGRGGGLSGWWFVSREDEQNSHNINKGVNRCTEESYDKKEDLVSSPSGLDDGERDEEVKEEKENEVVVVESSQV
jgi:hypothetical protein